MHIHVPFCNVWYGPQLSERYKTTIIGLEWFGKNVFRHKLSGINEHALWRDVSYVYFSNILQKWLAVQSVSHNDNPDIFAWFTVIFCCFPLPPFGVYSGFSNVKIRADLLELLSRFKAFTIITHIFLLMAVSMKVLNSYNNITVISLYLLS